MFGENENKNTMAGKNAELWISLMLKINQMIPSIYVGLQISLYPGTKSIKLEHYQTIQIYIYI